MPYCFICDEQITTFYNGDYTDSPKYNHFASQKHKENLNPPIYPLVEDWLILQRNNNYHKIDEFIK